MRACLQKMLLWVKFRYEFLLHRNIRSDETMELKRNILDIKGLKVGQAENPDAKTGVTVVLAENGAVWSLSSVRAAASPAAGV